MAQDRKRKIEAGLVQGRISGSIWKLAAPMMIGGILQDLFSMVDLYFVGKLGHIEVAALSISGIVVAILMMLVQGIAVGTLALVAQFVGEKKYEKADEVMGQTFILGLMGAAIMYIVRLFLVAPLLNLFGVSGEVLEIAAEYLEITFGWSIVIFFFVGINQALRGSGDASTPLKALILSNVLNIFLDPMLIMGYGIFPQLGVKGSAIATVCSRGFGLIFLILHTLFGHSTVHLKTKCFKPSLLLMRQILSIGSFASLQVLVREFSFLFLMRLISSFGDVTLAAYGIGSRIRMFIMVPGFGFASAASILTGQNLGANQPKRANKSAWRSVIYYEMIAIPIAVIFFIFTPYIVGIFNGHPEVIKIGSSFLKYIAVTFPFLAFSLVLGQAMNGAGDTMIPTIVNAIGQLLFRIPLAYIFALALDMGPSGIWLGINASDIVQGIGMIFIFRSGHWIKVYTRNRKKRGLKPFTPTTDAGLPSSGAVETL